MRRSLIIAAVAALALAGCGRTAPVERTDPEKSYRIYFGRDLVESGNKVYVNVWTDPDTGCQYLITDDGFAQPRMQGDGSQRCYRRGLPAADAGGPILPPPPALPAQ